MIAHSILDSKFKKQVDTRRLLKTELVIVWTFSVIFIIILRLLLSYESNYGYIFLLLLHNSVFYIFWYRFARQTDDKLFSV